MTTLYEQINTRKIVLPPELQEFFSTIYDTSKKYELYDLGKNLAWKPLIHKKEEDILILNSSTRSFGDRNMPSRNRTGASPNLLSSYLTLTRIMRSER